MSDKRISHKRLPNGWGGLSYLGDGRAKPWNIKPKGKDGLRHSQGCYATEEEAREALEVYYAKRILDLLPRDEYAKVTLGQLWEYWKDTALRDVSKAKYNTDVSSWNRTLCNFATRRMSDMTLAAWQGILDSEIEVGYASGTVRKTLTLIKEFETIAKAMGVIRENFSDVLVVHTTGPKQVRDAFDWKTVEDLIELASNDGPERETAEIILVLCYTGWRINELLAMPPDALDRDLWALKGGNKTDAGKTRAVPIHSGLRPIIEKYAARHGEVLFCRADGTPHKYRTYLDHFKKVLASVGVEKATPHWCRYTMETMLHEAEVDEITCKWLLGHESGSNMTAYYTKVRIGTLRAAINKLRWPEKIK